jgi:predicted choloylglycine hydrolase
MVWRRIDDPGWRCALARRGCAVLLLALVILGTSCVAPKQAGSVGKQSLSIPVVTLSGTATEMGTSHGRQLGEQIRPLHEQFLRQWIRSDVQRNLAVAIAQNFQPLLRSEHRDELNALAAAAGIDPQQAMLANCFLDVGGMMACSTLTLPGSRSPDGVPRFARNLDFPSFNVADKSSVLFVYKPADRRFGFVTVGWPGLIGALSGMNEHGLALACMEVSRQSRPPTAMPYPLLYRTLLERCRTVDEAIEWLRSAPKQTENNLMLMDAAGVHAVVEIYPDHIDVRKTDQPLISTNHRRMAAVPRFVPEYCPRYEHLEQATADKARTFDVPALQQLLREVAQGDMTLQSMIFEPSTGVMYLATGKNAPTRAWERIDVKALLR